MIAKGAARSEPKQLAVYLMRVGRYDTGEPAELLELQSPWAESENGTRERTAAKLAEAFRDWQTLAEGTKQGEYGLYHAQISPAPQYADTMTPEQWKRAADILGEELGLQDQPRAIVLHAGKDDRHHLHVVWSRTDIEEMKLQSDSFNYLAHERASERMELEFGQEFVPGKHAKRDRERQPEFPRQKMSQDEAQQAERLGITKEERIKQLAAIRQPCDDGLAFKNALEEAGYLLAKGNRRSFVLVDDQGETFSLSKYSPDLKGKSYKAFMASVDPATLPTVDEAKVIQEERQEAAKTAAPAEAPKQALEASKFVPPELAQKLEQPSRLPESTIPAYDPDYYSPQRQAERAGLVSKFLTPPEAPKSTPAPVQKVEPPAPAPARPEASTPQPIDLTLYAPKPREIPPPAPEKPAPPQEDPEVQAIKKALAERHAKEVQKWAEEHVAELRQLEHDLTVINLGKLKDFDAILAGERAALRDRHQQQRHKGIKGFIDAFQGKLNPAQEIEKAQERRREIDQLKAKQEKERNDYWALIQQTKKLEIENLKERQGLQSSNRERQREEEEGRYIREHHEAKRKFAEIEARRIHEELEKNENLREGPPPPRLGK